MGKGFLEQSALDTPVGFAECRERVYCFLGVLFFSRPGDEIPAKLLDGLEASLSRLGESYGLLRVPSAWDGCDLGRWLEQWANASGLRASNYRHPCNQSRDPGSSMLKLLEVFSRDGFQPGPALPPDHLGTELAFMANLCGREREAWNQGDISRAVHWLQEQRRFLVDHLAQWIPGFAREVQESDCCAAAKDLVALLDDFITEEADSIGLWVLEAQLAADALDRPRI